MCFFLPKNVNFSKILHFSEKKRYFGSKILKVVPLFI